MRIYPLFFLIVAGVLLSNVTFASKRSTSFSDIKTNFNAFKLVKEGRNTFRHETLGNETFWGDTLRLHEAIAGEANGGVGGGVSPATALAVGLRVDVQALPSDVKRAISKGDVDLDDPATTLALLRLNAVVGVKGFFNESDEITSVGLTCALCHSTVDDSFAPGIGNRRDGWPNRDLNVGLIASLAPNLAPVATMLNVDEGTVREVLNTWGPGRYDAAVFLDGQPFTPDGNTGAVLIPAVYGLTGVNLNTYTGWGSTAHWNAFVPATQLRSSGRFYDPRLNNAAQFPIAAANGFADITPEVDLVTPKLPALHFYQLALPVPKPPRGSFNRRLAAKGKQLFNGRAQCSTCHVPPIYTEPGHNLRKPEEIGIDDFQASRSPTGAYRTTPLGGLFAKTKGGFYHDGRFATLDDVLNHYNNFFDLDLSDAEKDQLINFLLSI